MDSETLVSENHAPESPASALPDPSYDCPVFEWIENFGRYADWLPTLISEVGRRFQDCGLPLARLSIVSRTLHPQIAAAGFAWNGATGEMSEFTGDRQSQSSEAYQRSPVRHVFEGSPGLRRLLFDPDCPRDFPILEELDADGVPDYVIQPIPFSNGQTYACSWATKVPGGFPDAAIARITQLMPAFSLVLEILAVRMISRNLMDTYLGHSAGERVLQGEIYRGVREPQEIFTLPEYA